MTKTAGTLFGLFLPFLAMILIAMLFFGMMSVTTPMMEKAIQKSIPADLSIPDPGTVTSPEISHILTNVVIDPTYSHAVEEHPKDAAIVRECFAKKGAYIQFQVRAKERYLRVCIIDEVNGLIGFQIVDIVGKAAKERTAYVKDTIKNLRQLFDYAKRMGYPRFTGPL